MNTHLTRISSNEKTGPIPVSTSSSATCPPSCPLLGKGCYARAGKLGLHWRKVSQGERGMDWETFCLAIRMLPKGQLWRHNQAGDLPGTGETVDASALSKLTYANKARRGFTYTHKHTTEANREAIRSANAQGFTINLSANTLAHADELAEHKCGPVVVLMPRGQTKNTLTPAGRKVVVCPATQRDDVTCATCGLCQKQRSAIVGFPAHGAAIKMANAVATNAQ